MVLYEGVSLKLEQMQEIAEYLEGTCNSIEQVLNAFGIKPTKVIQEQLEEYLADEGPQRCSVCDWGCEFSELEENEQYELVCEDCRND